MNRVSLDIVFSILRTASLDESGQIANCIDNVSNFPELPNKTSIPGIWNGKSRAASMIAKKIHHPHAQVMKVNAPAVF